MIPSTYPFPFVSPPFPYFQAFPATAMGGSATPAQADTSITANQGTPGPAVAKDAREKSVETQTQAGPAPTAAGGGGGGGGGGTTPRGPRAPWGSRAAIYPGGYAAYPPSPPMYPTPVWLPAGSGGNVEGEGSGGPGRRQAGVVYMPIMPGGYVDRLP
jgi:hypothetical protein